MKLPKCKACGHLVKRHLPNGCWAYCSRGSAKRSLCDCRITAFQLQHDRELVKR